MCAAGGQQILVLQQGLAPPAHLHRVGSESADNVAIVCVCVCGGVSSGEQGRNMRHILHCCSGERPASGTFDRRVALVRCRPAMHGWHWLTIWRLPWPRLTSRAGASSAMQVAKLGADCSQCVVGWRVEAGCLSTQLACSQGLLVYVGRGAE